MYDKLVAKVNNIDTTDLVLKTKYIADKTKYIAELENKIPDVSSLGTKTALTAVENKIPSVSNLVKEKQTITQKLLKLKTDLLTMIMINILQLQSLVQNLAADVFNARLAQANLITKTDFDAKLPSLNRRTTANK